MSSVSVLALAGSCLALLAGCAGMTAPPAPGVPEALKPPPGQQLALTLQAHGVQIYECKAAADKPGGFDWVFKAPEAELFDSAGRSVGKHYAGPTWEAPDGGKVVGEVKGRDNGPDANAVPWLLLGAKSNAGVGVFGRTQSIQRLNTVAGKAPADGCNAGQAGKDVRVAYRAVYTFYVAKP